MVGFGIPAAVFGAWSFREYGEIACILAVVGALLAAYLWGAIMWRLMFRDLYARGRATEESRSQRG